MALNISSPAEVKSIFFADSFKSNCLTAKFSGLFFISSFSLFFLHCVFWEKSKANDFIEKPPSPFELLLFFVPEIMPFFGSTMLWAALLMMLRCCVLWCFVLWKGNICCVVFWCQLLHGAYKVWLWWCFDSQVGLLLREKSVEQHLEEGLFTFHLMVRGELKAKLW